MIRKLKESDRQISLNFLSDEPAINLFIIGDIENNGVEEFKKIINSFHSCKIISGKESIVVKFIDI